MLFTGSKEDKASDIKCSYKAISNNESAWRVQIKVNLHMYVARLYVGMVFHMGWMLLVQLSDPIITDMKEN